MLAFPHDPVLIADIIIAVDDMDKSTPKQDPHRVLDLPTASWAGVLSPLSIESLSTASEEKRGEDIDSFGEKVCISNCFS